MDIIELKDNYAQLRALLRVRRVLLDELLPNEVDTYQAGAYLIESTIEPILKILDELITKAKG